MKLTKLAALITLPILISGCGTYTTYSTYRDVSPRYVYSTTPNYYYSDYYPNYGYGYSSYGSGYGLGLLGAGLVGYGLGSAFNRGWGYNRGWGGYHRGWAGRGWRGGWRR